ncbi:hypothetical protein BDP67DRAFT_487766 [Colletotrichum lupini]|nr:hypothetical protein BDP67DRAFT_487766 [Colletotrichum lupini]
MGDLPSKFMTEGGHPFPQRSGIQGEPCFTVSGGYKLRESPFIYSGHARLAACIIRRYQREKLVEPGFWASVYLHAGKASLGSQLPQLTWGDDILPAPADIPPPSVAATAPASEPGGQLPIPTHLPTHLPTYLPTYPPTTTTSSTSPSLPLPLPLIEAIPNVNIPVRLPTL